MYAEQSNTVYQKDAPPIARAYENAINTLQMELGSIESLIERAEREFRPVLLPSVPQIGGTPGPTTQPARECDVVESIQNAARRAASLSAQFKALLDRAAV